MAKRGSRLKFFPDIGGRKWGDKVNRFEELSVSYKDGAGRDAKCNACLKKRLSRSVATSLCFECETYLCIDCAKLHDFTEAFVRKPTTRRN